MGDEAYVTADMVFDLETTGFDVFNDRVVQFGALLLLRHDDEGSPIHEELLSFCSYVDPEGRAMHEQAAQVTGITADMLRSAPAFPEVWGRLLDEVNRALEPRAGDNKERRLRMVGHNSFSFDNHVLMATLARYGLDIGCIADHVCFADTLAHAKRALPDARTRKLGDLYRIVSGADLVDAHDALADCRAVARLLGDPRFSSLDIRQLSQIVAEHEERKERKRKRDARPAVKRMRTTQGEKETTAGN
jgi:DNA polymerase III epsilon subunit-like protein